MPDQRRIATIGLLAALICAPACGRESGTLVTNISDRLFGQLGLRENDVILYINRMQVRTADETAQAFEPVRGTGRVALIFERDGGRYMHEFYWRR
jgi:hypothetical protein